MSAESRPGAILELDQFCIETTARRRYQRLMTEVLESEEVEPAVKTDLEILRAFLDQIDFSAIRSAHEELCGGNRVRVLIYLDDRGRARWSKL